MRSPLRLVLAVCLVSSTLTACVVVPGDVPEKHYTAALLDSADGGAQLSRVEVRGDSTVDTIPGLRTVIPPVAVPRTGIVGFAYDSLADTVTHGFRYDPEKRRLHEVELPGDLIRAAYPVLSPDGRHVAYVGRAGDGKVRGVVRIWPLGRIVAAGPPVPPRGWSRADQAFWVSPDSFEVFIEIGGGPETFLVYKGTLSSGFTSIDTATVDGG